MKEKRRLVGFWGTQKDNNNKHVVSTQAMDFLRDFWTEGDLEQRQQ
jgi:hypothetical protein